MKERLTREIRFVVHPSLFNKFKDICDNQYTTVSESLRSFMAKTVRENSKQPAKSE